jgi:hypothetical protein
MTNYTVLKYNAEGAAWSELVDVDASSPSGAIRQASVEQGLYVAVPTRSWKPLAVKVETVTKTTIG